MFKVLYNTEITKTVSCSVVDRTKKKKSQKSAQKREYGSEASLIYKIIKLLIFKRNL